MRRLILRVRDLSLLDIKIDCLWFVQPEDTMGGWCIMNHPTLTPSKLDHRHGDPSGHIAAGIGVITDFISKEAAEHIVKLHNDWFTGTVDGR